MTHHDEEGAVGLVLSRPPSSTIAEAVPELGDLPCVDEVVYVGGPVQPEAVVVLVEFDELDGEAEAIVGNVAYLPPERADDELPLRRRARSSPGYSGWGPGQLESELEEPAWIVVAAEPDDVFASRSRRRSGAPSCSARAAASRCSRRCPTTRASISAAVVTAAAFASP